MYWNRLPRPTARCSVNPIYHRDAPIVPDISLSSSDEAAMDDGSYSPDRPFLIYFPGPFEVNR